MMLQPIDIDFFSMHLYIQRKKSRFIIAYKTNNRNNNYIRRKSIPPLIFREHYL